MRGLPRVSAAHLESNNLEQNRELDYNWLNQRRNRNDCFQEGKQTLTVLRADNFSTVRAASIKWACFEHCFPKSANELTNA